MILDPVLQRLAAINVYTGTVDGLAQIAKAPLKPAALYVLPGEESAAEGTSTSGYFEEMIGYGVYVVALVAVGAANPDLETLKESVKAQLLGWKHPLAERPTLYRGARLLPIEQARVGMILNFTVTVRVRTPLQGN